MKISISEILLIGLFRIPFCSPQFYNLVHSKDPQFAVRCRPVQTFRASACCGSPYDICILRPPVFQPRAAYPAKESGDEPHKIFSGTAVFPPTDQQPWFDQHGLLKTYLLHGLIQLAFQLAVRDHTILIDARARYQHVYAHSGFLGSFCEGDVQVEINLALGFKSAGPRTRCSQAGNEYGWGWRYGGDFC